jgi:hypothetical protein
MKFGRKVDFKWKHDIDKRFQNDEDIVFTNFFKRT